MEQSAPALLLKLGVCLGLVVGLAAPATAQTTPRAEASGGYQFLSLSSGGESEPFPKGWYVDLAGNLNQTWGVVFEVGGNYKSQTETATVGRITATATADIKLHEFMGGVRAASRKNPTVAPFVQVLAGAMTGSASFSVTSGAGNTTLFSASGAESGTNFAVQFGGGVTVGRRDKAGVRIGADYVRIFATDEGANLFRFAAGINIPF